MFRSPRWRGALAGDLGWDDAPAGTATVTAAHDGPVENADDLVLWSGSIEFTAPPEADRFRILVEEREQLPGGPSHFWSGELPSGRLVDAEAFAVDTALVSRSGRARRRGPPPSLS